MLAESLALSALLFTIGVVGVITRRNFLDPTKPDSTPAGELVTRVPAIIFPDNSLRQAADHMVRADIGRLVVVSREQPRKVIGFLTRSDLLRAHETRLAHAEKQPGTFEDA